jgi:glycosyltransferase involved in cell wall biosynthesis/predicted metal-dependent phosphoesterase TrpH
MQPNLVARMVDQTASSQSTTIGSSAALDGAAASPATRVDMHCHSTASEISRLGVQRAMGLPECATPPEEVYELAKRRGMDFVTITDHDTIAGVLQIADRPDVFISEELTASFRDQSQMVHVLCYGLTPADHEWLQAHSGDVEECAGYLHAKDIVCALAHPYYTVGAPLTARHRRRLADLFPIWEVRNGARARELNRPAAVYIATRAGVGIGGSDDHAGVDVGRTFTEAPVAATTPEEFLEQLRAGSVVARGAQGSAAKWAHAAIALTARALGRGTTTGEDRDSRDGLGRGDRREPDPRTVMLMAQRLLREADQRHGSSAGKDLTPQDARGLLRAWLSAVELDHLDERSLITFMQDTRFSHSDLYRRACRAHERKLRMAVDEAVLTVTATTATSAEATPEEQAFAQTAPVAHPTDGSDVMSAAVSVFEACTAAIPYAPATAFLGREKAKLDSREGETPRVAILADGIGSTHGVTRTIEEIRQRGVPGFEIEVIGTDANVDRRLAAVAEIDVPFYPGLKIGVPSLTVAVETLAEGNFDVIHVCSPGPVGIAGALVARGLCLPLVGSYHTELTAYAALRSRDARVAGAMDLAVRTFYTSCDLVLSPSSASDEALGQIGVDGGRLARWDRGVDTARFDPSLRGELRLPGVVNVLYVGRITREKGSELLADAFLEAHHRDPRLHLVLAGGGPEQEHLRERLGEHATFLGWLHGPELAQAYASADVFVFPSATDTFGQVILEAHASGLPVVAVARGGPLSLVQDGVSGLLCQPDAHALGERVVQLAASPLLRRRLAGAGLAAVRERTWDSALERLAGGYRRVLADAGANDGDDVWGEDMQERGERNAA